MKSIFSLRKHSYLKTIGTFIIAVALIAGVVGCEGEPGPEYTLTMAENPTEGGTATDETSGSPYAEGTDVNIKAVPNAGYEFDGWSAPAGTFADADARETTFTMPAQNVTVTANFVLLYDLTMAVSPAGGGTATDDTGTSPYPAGTVVDISAVATPPYQFVKWTAPAGSFADPNASTTTFTMPAEDVTATANFVGPLDHFKCYQMWDEEPLEKEVFLEDQFVAIDATVLSPSGFCNPTDKAHLEDPYEETPLWNPDYHLMLYHIFYEGEPVTRYVEVENQFGLEELMVRGPYGLAVPTQKIEPGSHEPPLRLDHYLLYEVLGAPHAEELVALNDQFSSEPDAYVYAPLALGVPVQKTDAAGVTEIFNPNDHLLFYEIWVEGEFTTQVQIANQFQQGVFDVYEPLSLAVPSTKTELPAPPPLDHFKGYTLIEPIPAEPNEIYLEDQFGAFWAEATLAWEFCNPVSKNGEPLWYPDNHLTLYDIYYEEPLPYWDVYVRNQFGEQYLEVDLPVKLAVPTWKLEPPGHEPPVDLDHFLLYEAYGEPIDLPVDLADEFGLELGVWVMEPVFFANPVQKTHGPETPPLVNPWGHLVFYRIMGAGDMIPIVVDNQFNSEYLSWTLESYYLAVPTEKLYYYEYIDY